MDLRSISEQSRNKTVEQVVSNDKEQMEIVEMKPLYLYNKDLGGCGETSLIKTEEQFVVKEEGYSGCSSEEIYQFSIFSSINTEQNENNNPKSGVKSDCPDMKYQLKSVYVKEDDSLYHPESMDELGQDLNRYQSDYRGNKVCSNENPLKCSFCSYIGSHDYILGRHVMTAHSNVKHLKCHYCQYFCGHEKLIEEHVNLNHLCSLCGYIGGSLQKHLESVHVKEPRDECSLCDYSKDRLDDLIESACLASKYECPRCDYVTQRKANFKAHLLSNHRCKLCDFVGCCKGHLNGHLLRAHPVPNHQKCLYCDYVGDHRGFVKIHVNSNHKCHVCEHVGENIGGHVMSAHRDRIDWKCNLCDYVGDPDHLSRHLNYVHFEADC